MNNQLIKGILQYVPGLKKIIKSNEVLKSELKKYKTFYPPGHFYSPIHSQDDLRNYTEKKISEVPLGIDLNIKQQKYWLESFFQHKSKLIFPDQKQEGFRYYYENVYFGYGDGVILQLFIHSLQPKKIIEVGSGFSSALMLDLNDRFYKNNIHLQFIEPYPDRLNSLLTANDKIDLYTSGIQEVDISLFEQLEENDILFIDSTHVSKYGSDVNKLLFEILPRLKKGVFIHIHDIFWCFEYPLNWLQDGWAWNEAYMLRSFLQFNDHFSIQYYNSFAQKYFQKEINQELPVALKNTAGSIWLKKEK